VVGGGQKGKEENVLMNIIGDSITSNKHTNKLPTKDWSYIDISKWQLKIINGSRNSEAEKG